MIDLNSSIKKTSNLVFSSPLLNGILGSSLFVAVVISLIMVILIMLYYPAQLGTPFSIVCKIFIYMFLASFLVVFLHDGVFKFLLQEQEQERNDEDILSGTNNNGRDVVYNNTPMVNPNTVVIPTQPVAPQPVVPVYQPNVIEGGGGSLKAAKAPPQQPNLFN